jgi:hypothetical protein
MPETAPPVPLTYIAAIPWSDAWQSTPLADFRAVTKLLRRRVPTGKLEFVRIEVGYLDFLGSMSPATWAQMLANVNAADLGGPHIMQEPPHYRPIATLDDYNAFAASVSLLPRLVVDPDVPDGLTILRRHDVEGNTLSEVTMRVS